MTDRPILFSAPMIRALLEGRKTQTRRVLNPPREVDPKHFDVSSRWIDPDRGIRFVHWPNDHAVELFKQPSYAPGDRLWVREAWRCCIAYDDQPPRDLGGEEAIRYEATGEWETWGWLPDGPKGRFRQGMHMPRWASRLTLTVTDVRVQRLQEISEADAKAEGYEGDIYATRASCWFRAFWDSLNADRGFGWDANPWVCALTFDVHRQNIDQMEMAA